MKPIGVFVNFLKGLEGENDNRRKSFREAEGESVVNVLLSYHLEIATLWKDITPTSFTREARFSCP